MRQLKQASRELFRRTPDEAFPGLESLLARCRAGAERSEDLWRVPRSLSAVPEGGSLALETGDAGPLRLNDWSFTQLCSLARVSKDTVNRLTPETAGRVLEETLPRLGKPVQLFTEGDRLRSLHGVAYTRLHNEDVLAAVSEAAVGFCPPPEGAGGKTGLYAGEQDMFAFLIDPAGWAGVGGEAFAPGFFVWNSEVGRRSVGVPTFWFQAVCRNHVRHVTNR